MKKLEYAQVKLLGFVLNGVELEKASYGYGKCRYRKYGYYGYDNGYGTSTERKQAAEQVKQ